jgi:spore coat polysaccharide biosynthesis protein SpsF (cytidylyltransferase family)
VSGAVVGIQARMGSSRLPGKVLADLAGEPLILRLVERARASSRVRETVVLTTADPSDDPLCEVLERAGVPHRRGPVDDVLRRYTDLVDETGADHVLRVTGDCPLIDPGFLDLQVEAAEALDADFAVVPAAGARDTLAGQSLVSARALRGAATSSDPRDREHVGSFWLLEHRDRYRTVHLDVPAALLREGVRLCVDEREDLELVRAVFEHFAPEHGSLAPLAEVLTWLDAHPEVRALNHQVASSAANQAARALDREASPYRVVGSWPPAVRQHA